LLDYVSERASDWNAARAVGVESEMELAYSGLHQLCAPMLNLLDRLPPPQREALSTVFGLSSGPPPERFLVGLATLTMMAEVSENKPLLCVVDDAHWLDEATAQVLGFVARRLLAERIALVCVTRSGLGEDVLAGVPQLPISGLSDSDAEALLLENMPGPIDAEVCRQFIAESHGNPLALLELPRTWKPTDFAGGFGFPSEEPVVGKIEGSYGRRLRLLPSETRLLVLAAAADPLGDPVLLSRASALLGLDMECAAPALDAGLLTLGMRVEFSHPLIRSAAYRLAGEVDRHRVHKALAEATDPFTDPDRAAWHRAHATTGPNEEVAVELERSALRAQARGGIAAAAAFLQRSVALTADPAERSERSLAAAEANVRAGRFEAAGRLLATAEAGRLDEFQRARVILWRGQLELTTQYGPAAPLLFQAARRLEQFDLDLARETYLQAWAAAVFAGSDDLPEISLAILALPPLPESPRPPDLLLDGLALIVTDGHATAVPTLQRAANALATIPPEDVVRWGWLAHAASCLVWDIDGMLALPARSIRLIREIGAIARLPLPLAVLGAATAWAGDLPGAASLVVEAKTLAAATGVRFTPLAELRLLALQGREAEAVALIDETIEQARPAETAIALATARWAAAVLFNGLGRYEQAAQAAQKVLSYPFKLYDAVWVLPELVEAAARAGNGELACDALERLAKTTKPSETDFAFGIEARCRALLSEGEIAEEFYREAVERLSRTPVRPELARAHLLYGEWLRREGRRIDGREQLRFAHETFAAIGMEAFAERARRELLATGEKVRKRSAETRDQLTPQEEQIARLARDGYSNPEIGAQLFLSARTVEWHLRKVFAKLGISSRRDLRVVLSADKRANLSENDRDLAEV
jgi:DNA-binding CsgD family transcriptional regulator